MEGDTLVADRKAASPAQAMPAESAAGQAEPPARRSPVPFIVLAIVLLLAAGGGFFWWWQTRNLASTDDAFIDTNISQVSAQIAGRTTAILVDDNQLVQAGQVLVKLDPRDWQVKLDQAEAQRGSAQAQLAQAQAMVGVQQASIDQAEANVRVTEADLTQAQQDATRYHALSPQAVARQQVDNANAGLRSAQARLDAMRQTASGARAQLESARAQVVNAQASLRNAEVGVENARLQLSYTDVVAPQAGRVTKRNVEPGNYVMAGQSLLAIVPRETWVTANFKETQLVDMKPGQPVEIGVDAFPAFRLHGKVDSFQFGTGSVFSSLPVENATGNWVKVLQRLPVKIVFDDPRAASLALAPGMSVTATVTVR
jgi:membrane fusion protein (multidrug efflux system)